MTDLAVTELRPTDKSRWLICRKPHPNAAFRLYCFPYVGGTAGEFLRWADQLPDVEIWGVVPPGRGQRLSEPPFTNLKTLVDALVGEVEFRRPFALFGHSLGALVGYETARALSATGRKPACLFVSGHRPPHLPHIDQPVHHLHEREFRAIVQERYPTPPAELTEDTELYDLILQTLRADLTVFETYRHPPGPPLDCPIAVISGRDDHWTEHELVPWDRHTTTSCQIRMVSGDHFYLPRYGHEVVEIINETLRGLGGRPGSTADLRRDRRPA